MAYTTDYNITAIRAVRTTSTTEQDWQQRHLTTPHYQCDFLPTEKRVSAARFTLGFSQLANRLFTVRAAGNSMARRKKF